MSNNTSPARMYRGKRTDTQEWVYGYYTPFVVHGIMRHYIIPAKGICFDDALLKDVLVEVIPETVGQYIGLKDKKGKEIYEGDILTSEEYPYKESGKPNYNAEVCWFYNTASFGIMLYCVNPTKRGISNGNTEQITDDDSFEVIGNIHDNLELIK